MVEGPKYHRHAELLAAVLRGKKLVAFKRAAKELERQIAGLVGCVVLEVFAVGKELLVVFGGRWSPAQRGNALRLHFGHGGGYVVERLDGEAWGSKADGGGHRREMHAQTQLDFEEVSVDESSEDVRSGKSSRSRAPDLKLHLWDELGSRYTVVPAEYIRACEAKSVFDINASEERFGTEDALAAFMKSEELVVDLIMDQARLPGVGNIIKCEGLFEARIHPLRRASELSRQEWLQLLKELRLFSDNWYRHCQLSLNGQMMGCCHLMRIYGHWSCRDCNRDVKLIKEGTRQRITYFCPSCQPDGQPEPASRFHRMELSARLPRCLCGDRTVLLQRRAGNYMGSEHDRRAYLSCPRRHGSSYDDGGCGIKGDWDGCGFMKWLDEMLELPKCYCGETGLVRRVSGLRENGRHFVRCATKACGYRAWFDFEYEADARRDVAKNDTAVLTADATPSSGPDLDLKQDPPADNVASGTRWQRRSRNKTVTKQDGYPAPACPNGTTRAVPPAVDYDGGSSTDPVTSGEEGGTPPPASSQRLRGAPPKTGLRERRWARS
eukprot:TRINITY_DN19618_c0_g1_i1.p1 TRINITY_DN19618_c0_g1~~TRINITY_DN19618_c0_g1_i1.p1  ORF type:complete len:551 (-),score=81.48 TRINITY_DN19618_c0_g1_i1:537-2189(-)